jgi:hypothetical protein
MADEWKWVMGIIVVVAIAMIFTGHLGGNIQFQGVIGTDCPVFRTNAVTLADFGTTTTWVATDCDNNGIYESYGMDPSAATGWIFTPKGTAITDYEYMCKSAGFPVYNYVLVRKVGNSWYNAFKQNYGYASSADITCVGTCTPSCTDKVCGDDGCGGSCGTCTLPNTCNTLGLCVVPTVPGTCDYTGNGDGKIDRDELGIVGMRWITGN